jgi:hypothetical protein
MTSTQILDNLNNAVREKPIAAALIGLGLAWVVFGRTGPLIRQSGVMRGAMDAIDTTADVAAGAASGAFSEAQKAASGLIDALSQGVETASSKIGDAVEGLLTQNQPKNQSEFGRHFPSPPSSRFAHLLDRQPLALAAVGMAVGAALASAFPSTGAEGRIMGSAGEKLKETVAAATDTIVERTAAAVEEAIDEAGAQNLTPGAVKDAVKEGAEKLKSVADAGLDSLKR